MYAIFLHSPERVSSLFFRPVMVVSSVPVAPYLSLKRDIVKAILAIAATDIPGGFPLLLAEAEAASDKDIPGLLFRLVKLRNCRLCIVPMGVPANGILQVGRVLAQIDDSKVMPQAWSSFLDHNSYSTLELGEYKDVPV